MYLLELGGEDDGFAILEAEQVASGVEPLAPGLAVAETVDPGRIWTLSYTHRASEVVDWTDADLASAQACLEAASLDRRGSVAVRAVDVRGSTGIDTQAVERELGSVLVERGFTVDLDDPDHELRAAFAADEIGSSGTSSSGAGTVDVPDDESVDGRSMTDRRTGERPSVCALGWLVAASRRDFGDRKPTEKPFFQPGSMDPLLARAVANLAGARPGTRLLDPMCGTGGVLLEAGLVGADVVGTDAQTKMVRGARRNLEHFLEGEHVTVDLARADATRLPFAEGAFDAVLFDAPYGRQSKIAAHRLEELVSGALSETRRVADRAVVVADRSWREAAREAGWTVEATVDRRVHRSLTRHVLVLE